MFETSKMFNGMFGKIEPGMCRITVGGDVAVKCSGGTYKTYNVKKSRLTNVSNFCFDIGSEFFFVIPTNKVNKGDIILVDHKPKCVIEVTKSVITVIDYESSEIRQVVPERHIFMGSAYFYGKIVSMFGNQLKGGKGLGGMMKLMMLSQMMSGGNQSGMGQMMAMSMFMGGKDNPFEGLFDEISLDPVEEEETKEEEEEA